MLMSKIYVVNSDMKNVIGMSDPNVMFKGPGPLFHLSLGIFQKLFFRKRMKYIQSANIETYLKPLLAGGMYMFSFYSQDVRMYYEK